LSLEQNHPREAEAQLRQVLSDSVSMKVSTYVRFSTPLLLARALLAQGKITEAQQVLAAGGVSAKEAPTIRFGQWLLIYANRIRAASGKPEDVAQATKSLEDELADCERHGTVNQQFQARLALGEIRIESGARATGRAQLASLEKDAQAKGFGLIARQAAEDLRK
jgi:hypothetical protein